MDEKPRIAPIGHDPMVATPNGQGLTDKLDRAQAANEKGLSTVSDKDIALLKARVEGLVKQMVASGASDAQIQQAVGNAAGNPELASIAKDMAQQQLDAEKFNLFSTRGQSQNQGFAMADVSHASLGNLSPSSTPDLSVKGIVKSILGV